MFDDGNYRAALLFTAVTDAAGQATFCYTSALPGADTITGQNGIGTLTHLTIDGGAGDDTIYAGYGDNALFRGGLAARGWRYAVAVKGTVSVPSMGPAAYSFDQIGNEVLQRPQRGMGRLEWPGAKPPTRSSWPSGVKSTKRVSACAMSIGPARPAASTRCTP